MPGRSTAKDENILMLVAHHWCEGRIYASPAGFRWKHEDSADGHGTQHKGRLARYPGLMAAAGAAGLDMDGLLKWMTGLCARQDTQFGMKFSPPPRGELRRAVKQLRGR